MPNQRLTFFILCMASILFCWNCTRTINTKIEETGNLPTPLIKPLPLTVGLYYSDNFRNYTHNEKNTDVQLGKANVALFNYILENSFKEVIPLKSLPYGDEDFKNIDVIIEPKVHLYSPWSPDYLWYEIVFYLPNEKRIIWRIKGTNKLSLVVSISSNNVKKRTQFAMRDIAAKFMRGFCNQEDIRKHFYRQCNQ